MNQQDQIERDEAINTAIRQITTTIRKRRTSIADIAIGVWLGAMMVLLTVFLLSLAVPALGLLAAAGSGG